MTTETMLTYPSTTVQVPRSKSIPLVTYEMSNRLLILPTPQLDTMSQILTEDDTPVDNFPSAKNQRLLVEPLYSSWSLPSGVSAFLADANVGIFFDHPKPLVPDVFLSLGVQVSEQWWEKRNRSYFLREFGKPPEVVIEVVSNRKGEARMDTNCMTMPGWELITMLSMTQWSI
jgi:hypothetical protein